MKLDTWRWAALAGLAMFVTGASLASGCATSVEPGEAGGADAGGQTGDGATGGTGGVANACGMDCSVIATPDCYVAVCNDGAHPGPVGSCVVVPDEDGAPCEDGLFCTVQDSCQAGVCTGGPQNDCGVTATPCNQVVCDEASTSCSLVASSNGAACTSSDLCVVGATCQNGLCIGGITKDCFFEPVPNECHVSVCNPTTGLCEPVVGNEGGSCVDTTQLCQVGMTCANGVCQGGAPVDCSALTVGCFNGVCDTGTGQCIQVPVPQGGSCLAATDDCNAGECDANGNCIGIPMNQGGVCDDDNGCTSGTTCNNGACTGGTQITACIDNDGCCPPTCAIGGDNDCCDPATEVLYNGKCYYLDGSMGVCDPGYVLGPQTVLYTIGPLFGGKTYKHQVSNNCCIYNSEPDEDFGMAGHCNAPGPFSSTDVVPGGAGCTNQMLLLSNQLTLCMSGP